VPQDHSTPTVCRWPGCGRTKFRARGLCGSHYNRATREGSLDQFPVMPPQWGPTGSTEYRTRKAEYDRQYRAVNRDELLARKRQHYHDNRERYLERGAKQRASAAYRTRHKAYLERYTATPEWKAHKREYDRLWRANSRHGPEWGPCHVALMELLDELDSRMTWVERKQQAGTLNKSQRRKRASKSETQRRRAQGALWETLQAVKSGKMAGQCRTPVPGCDHLALAHLDRMDGDMSERPSAMPGWPWHPNGIPKFNFGRLVTVLVNDLLAENRRLRDKTNKEPSWKTTQPNNPKRRSHPKGSTSAP